MQKTRGRLCERLYKKGLKAYTETKRDAFTLYSRCLTQPSRLIHPYDALDAERLKLLKEAWRDADAQYEIIVAILGID